MLQDILMVLMTVLIMGGAIIFIKKTNPGNRRRITYYSTKDVFEKKICTKCGVKMKKTWNREVDNPLEMNLGMQKELIATPVYTCLKCGYKIEKGK